MTMDTARALREKQRLKELDACTWLPQELRQLAGEILALQRDTEATLSLLQGIEAHCCLPAEHAQGKPLLALENLPFNEQAVAHVFSKILLVLEQCSGLAAITPQVRAFMLSRYGASANEVPAWSQGVASLVRAVLHDDATPFEAFAEQCPQSPKALYFITHTSVLPWLRQAASAVLPLHQAETWGHGHCPVCGGAVFFGHFGAAETHPKAERVVDKGGRRMHTCGLCQSTFRVKRLQCPFCLEEDSTKLRYFTVDDIPNIQVHTCSSCKSYIKIADFRERLHPEVIPLLDDLASLPLDFAAASNGFARPGMSPWGL